MIIASPLAVVRSLLAYLLGVPMIEAQVFGYRKVDVDSNVVAAFPQLLMRKRFFWINRNIGGKIYSLPLNPPIILKPGVEVVVQEVRLHVLGDQAPFYFYAVSDLRLGPRDGISLI